MTISIRELDPQTDYEGVAAIINFYEPEPVTADELRQGDTQVLEGRVRHRLVALNAEGRMIGYAAAARVPWMQPGRFNVHVLVDPADCRRGVGAQMFADCLTFLRANDATSLETWVFDNMPQSLRFAEKQGFTIHRHIFESTLDVRAFDATPYAGVIEHVEASGIRLFSLADVGNTPETRRKVWEIDCASQLDIPGTSGETPSLEEFEKIWATNDWFREDGQLLAADGDRFIGLAAVSYHKDSNSAYNRMTGVLPDYRGRKIALALKLLAIRTAQKWGVDYIRTNNDSQNASILAINRRLGYVAEPGGYRMTKQIS